MGFHLVTVRAWLDEGERPGQPLPPSGGGGFFPDQGFNPDYPSQGLPGYPGRPGQGLPWPGRPVDPGFGWPGYSPGQGLPGGGYPGAPDQGFNPNHPDQGFNPGSPGQGLPPQYPGRPGQGLPWPGAPVDPGYGLPGFSPGQGLPGGGESAVPHAVDVGDHPTEPGEFGSWAVAIYGNDARWVWVPAATDIDEDSSPDQSLPDGEEAGQVPA